MSRTWTRKTKKKPKRVLETREQALERRERDQQEIRRGFMADSLKMAKPHVQVNRDGQATEYPLIKH